MRHAILVTSKLVCPVPKLARVFSDTLTYNSLGIVDKIQTFSANQLEALKHDNAVNMLDPEIRLQILNTLTTMRIGEYFMVVCDFYSCNYQNATLYYTHITEMLNQGMDLAEAHNIFESRFGLDFDMAIS